jgi:putative membrane protein
MMRYLRYGLIAVFGLALLTVSIANRDLVTIHVLPTDLAAMTGLTWAVQIPLFLILFGGIALGVAIGFVWEWMREGKHRSAASTKSREVARLERELAVMRDASSVPPKDEVLALLDRKKAS